MAPEYDELLILAQTLGEVKTKTDKLEAEFATQAKPFEAATSALYSAISGIKALQFHVLDNNLGKLSTRVEEMRQAINEQVGVIALELKKADAENATKAGQDADSLRAAIADVQANLGTLANQFVAQLQRVEFEAKEEAKKLQLIPGPAGAAGASLNPRGTFVDGETYNRLDVVTWLGSSYIAAVDGVKEKPSKNSNQWQVLASRGSGGAGGAGDFGSLAGVAQINQGGTGQTTRAAGLNALLPSQTGNVQYMLLTDGAGNVSWGAQPVAGLPSQTSNSGKLLTTDGTNASWSNAVTVSGSNATVTGTLTVNGGATVGGGSFAAASFYKSSSLGSVLSGATGSSYDLYITNPAGNYILQVPTGTRNAEFAGTLTTVGNATVGAALTVQATTASTTTSTGALVVSGGVGVAGAINVAGNATVFGASGITINNVGGLGTDSVLTLSQSGVSNAFIKNTATTGDIAIGDGGGTYLRITKGVGVVSVLNSTASTSTSSGALVVSGGVGVAKRIHSGEGLTTGGDNDTHISFVRNGTVSIGPDSTATPALVVSSAIKTAAPSGGTAANWKLGTVATVSPTSPNRTIEVDIGGTIYYIAAKTTNN